MYKFNKFMSMAVIFFLIAVLVTVICCSSGYVVSQIIYITYGITLPWDKVAVFFVIAFIIVFVVRVFDDILDRVRNL